MPSSNAIGCTATAFGVVLAALLLPLAPSVEAQVLVDLGSPTTYLANETDPGIAGSAWTASDYDDSGWSEGLLGIGYEVAVDAGDFEAGPLLTTFVPVGSLSVYTRTTFRVADPSAVASLRLALDYDDAVVAWINGVEIYRSPEMPAGDPSWNRQPRGHESSNGVDPDFSRSLDLSAVAIPLLRAGGNTLAIGVWNDSVRSTDLVLIPRLWANDPAAFVTRGPYLQRGSHERITIRWRTDRNTTSRVGYGPAPGQLDRRVSTGRSRKDHEIVLTGLKPDTTYYYAVGTVSQMLVGGDLEHSFRTAPLPGTRRPIRVWVVGDTGTPTAESAAVRDAFVERNGGDDVDVWLMLGDIAYDYGNIHFVVLDSQDSSRLPKGPMLSWLAKDLKATQQDWIIACWHHPPYSKGSYDSDNARGSDLEIVEMRRWAVPVLEKWGVDLVLNGHSHVYERSFLLAGHHGFSDSLTPSMLLDDGDGNVDGDGAYQKPARRPGSRGGAVYVVAGNGSEVFDIVPGHHPAMLTSQVRVGSMVLDVDGDRLEATMIDASGKVRDRFAIVKNEPVPPIGSSRLFWLRSGTIGPIP